MKRNNDFVLKFAVWGLFIVVASPNLHAQVEQAPQSSRRVKVGQKKESAKSSPDMEDLTAVGAALLPIYKPENDDSAVLQATATEVEITPVEKSAIPAFIDPSQFRLAKTVEPLDMARSAEVASNNVVYQLQDQSDDGALFASSDEQISRFQGELSLSIGPNPLQRTLVYVDSEGSMLPTPHPGAQYIQNLAGYRMIPAGDHLYRNGVYGDWLPTVSWWESPNFYHNPLYFEDRKLERYGGHYGVLQTALSAAHFFQSVATLPHQIGADPPRCRHYPIGLNRPGNPHCFYAEYPRLDRRGLTLQALLGAATLFALP